MLSLQVSRLKSATVELELMLNENCLHCSNIDILSKASQTDSNDSNDNYDILEHATTSENTILQTSKLKIVELQNLAQEEKLINKGIFDKVSFSSKIQIIFGI